MLSFGLLRLPYLTYRTGDVCMKCPITFVPAIRIPGQIVLATTSSLRVWQSSSSQKNFHKYIKIKYTIVVITIINTSNIIPVSRSKDFGISVCHAGRVHRWWTKHPVDLPWLTMSFRISQVANAAVWFSITVSTTISRTDWNAKNLLMQTLGLLSHYP